MEDHRDDLIVIAAGYSRLMDTFLASNPGIRSRFTRTIEFPDYSAAELVEIVHGMATSSGFELSTEASAKLMTIFANARAHGGESFGNARLARNLFEHALAKQADRISSIAGVSREELCALNVLDIPDSEEFS